MPHKRNIAAPVSDHFDGVRFFNTAPRTRDRGFSEVVRWRRTSRPARWPAAVPVVPHVPEARRDATRVTLVGHATVLIQTRAMNLLTDPVWSERASPLPFLGPRRVAPPGIAFDALPPIDAVLLSHNHYDHFDLATLRRLVARHDPVIVTPFGNDALLRRVLPQARLTAGDWWDSLRLGGVEVTFLPAQHWSARGLFDRRKALWCGFALRAGREMIYFAGDTGYGDGSLFAAIRDRLGRPDLALLPIGAYAPRWFMADHHIDPAEAVRIFAEMEADRALAIHWGVFRLSDESRTEPRDLLLTALAERGIAASRFHAAEPGFVWDAGP